MSWFTGWFGGRRTAPGARRRGGARLRLHELEERQVPTVNYYQVVVGCSLYATEVVNGSA
jgi:hypothetical protein